MAVRLSVRGAEQDPETIDLIRRAFASTVPTAAYDPVFWSHHAMIDRLWYIWQISQKGAQPPTDLLSVVLSPFPVTVAQTLDIANLRYEYAVQASV